MSAVQTADGVKKWSFTQGNLGFIVSVDGKYIFSAAQTPAGANELRAIDVADGITVKWTFTGSPTASSLSTPRSSPDGKAVYVSQFGETSADTAQLSAINTADGNEIWGAPFALKHQLSEPWAVSSDSKVVFSSSTNGWYTAVNASTGEMKWQIKYRFSRGMSNLDKDSARFVTTTAGGWTPGSPATGAIYVLSTLMDREDGYTRTSGDNLQVWQSKSLATLAYVVKKRVYT